MSRLTGVLVVLAAIVAVPVLACDAPVTAAVVKEILRVKDRGEVVFVKQSRGVLKPAISKHTTELRSTVIAEEILADFEKRNAETVELSVPDAIELKDYWSGDDVDWARLDRDFPGVDTVIELSRPGCDTQSTFAIVQARYRLRDARFPDEGRIFHVEKQSNGTWDSDRQAVWNAEYFAQ